MPSINRIESQSNRQLPTPPLPPQRPNPRQRPPQRRPHNRHPTHKRTQRNQEITKQYKQPIDLDAETDQRPAEEDEEDA